MVREGGVEPPRPFGHTTGTRPICGAQPKSYPPDDLLLNLFACGVASAMSPPATHSTRLLAPRGTLSGDLAHRTVQTS